MEPCPQCGQASTEDPENGLVWCFACRWFYQTTPLRCSGLSRTVRFTNTRAPYSLRRH